MNSSSVCVLREARPSSVICPRLASVQFQCLPKEVLCESPEAVSLAMRQVASAIVMTRRRLVPQGLQCWSTHGPPSSRATCKAEQALRIGLCLGSDHLDEGQALGQKWRPEHAVLGW